MRAAILGIVAGSLLFGQASKEAAVERTFYFTHTEGEQNMQEMATAIRTLGDIKQLQVNSAQKSLTLSGSVDQVALATWMFNELDQAKAPAPPSREYRKAADDVVVIYYLAKTATIQDFQEEATLIRTISEIRRVFTYNAPRAMMVRGTADQIALANWMVAELDKPADQTPREYRYAAGSPDDVVRVFYLPAADPVQKFQQNATNIRTQTQIRRVFTYNSPHAMAVRGTVDQVAIADRMVKELVAAAKPTTPR